MSAVAIVLVTYNSADWIGQCLDSLDAATDGIPAEVVVVDNASSDGSADLVAARHPDVTLVCNTANRGFAAAVNQGVAASRAPWILLLNPDMVARPGSLRRLLEFGQRHPGRGIYGGRTLTPDGSLEPSSCWAAPSLWSTVCFAFGLSHLAPGSRLFDHESIPGWDRDSVREVGIVTGCLMLVERSDWERLGGFDERYFVYGEDADLAARARRLGLRLVVTPDAEVVHAVGASSASTTAKLVLLLAGKVTYARDHFRAPMAAVAVALLRLGVALRAHAVRPTGAGGGWAGAWVRRAEWWDGFPDRGGIPNRGDLSALSALEEEGPDSMLA